MSDGGDLVWLDDRTLLIGRGDRTNRSGYPTNQGNDKGSGRRVSLGSITA